MIRRCLMTSLIIVTFLAIAGGDVLAQDASPAQPSQAGAGDECMKDYLPLRAEAEKRGQLIKAAGNRRAPPDDLCKLITDYGQSEIAMIRYLEANMTICAIPARMPDQLKSAHKTAAALQNKVCASAQQRGPAGPTGDFSPASTNPPM
jgi:hypothetical protein